MFTTLKMKTFYFMYGIEENLMNIISNKTGSHSSEKKNCGSAEHPKPLSPPMKSLVTSKV